MMGHTSVLLNRGIFEINNFDITKSAQLIIIPNAYQYVLG